MSGALSLRLDYERMIGDAARLELGTVAKYNDRLQYDIDFSGSARPDASGTPQPLDLDTSLTAFRVGSYGELTARWTPRFSTTLGGRVDYYEYLGDAVRVAPRLAATLDLGGATTLNLSGGRYWQEGYPYGPDGSSQQALTRPRDRGDGHGGIVPRA